MKKKEIQQKAGNSPPTQLSLSKKGFSRKLEEKQLREAAHLPNFSPLRVPEHTRRIMNIHPPR